MKKNRGFTLIELLAVIIILGVIMLIAIPSVTKQITNTRKTTYAETARGIIGGARTIVNSGELPVYKPRTTYYIPAELVSTENSKRSPFGDFVDAYVVVTSEKDGYEYYWTSNDTSKTGILLTHYNNLDKSIIKNNVDKISTDVAICGNDNIVVFNSDGSVKEEKEATECINPKETYDGTGSVVTKVDFFDFDSNSGTITSVHDIVTFELLDPDRCATYLQNIGYRDTFERVRDYCINDFEDDIYGEDDIVRDMVSQGIIKYSRESYPRNLVIPEEINGVAVTTIDSNVFLYKDLNTVKLPSSLKRIESNAFSESGLKSVVIPNGVTYIGNGAFSGNFFSKVTIPSSVTEIGNGAFYNCPILCEVINKTNKEFYWGSVFGYGGDSSRFVTGNYEYSMSEENFHSRYFYDPYHVTISVTNEDNLDINIDSMFEMTRHSFNLVNNNGYKVYTYDLSSRSYTENSTGEMESISGYCGALLTNYYITDSNNNILHQGFYKYYEENSEC